MGLWVKVVDSRTGTPILNATFSAFWSPSGRGDGQYWVHGYPQGAGFYVGAPGYVSQIIVPGAATSWVIGLWPPPPPPTNCGCWS